MFGIGLGEAVVIFVVALLVFGPEKMPGIARAVGRAMGELRRALSDAQTEITTSVNETQTKPPADNSWTYTPNAAKAEGAADAVSNTAAPDIAENK